MSEQKTTETTDESLLAMLSQSIDDITRTRYAQIKAIGLDAEKQRVRVSFSVIIDYATKAPSYSVKISFGQKTTDEITGRTDDPDQGKML